MFRSCHRIVSTAALIALAGAAPAQVFQRAIGTEADERAWDVEQAEGGYVTVGQLRDGPHGGTDIYVCRYDTDGELVWDAIIGGQGEDIGYSIAKDGVGGFIVGAETKSVAAGRELALVRLDGSGSILWARAYNGEFQSDALHPLDGVAVETLPQGGFAAVHHYRGNPTLLRVRPDGSMVFHRGYSVGVSNQGFQQRIGFTDLKVDRAEPGFIVSGSREEQLQDGVQQDFLLSRFTMSGDPVYMRALDTASLKNPDHWVNEKGTGIDFIDGDTGHIVIGGITDFGVPGQAGLQIITADILGMPIDVRSYDVSPGIDITGRGLISGYASLRADRAGEIGFASTFVNIPDGVTRANLLNVDSFSLLPHWMWNYKRDSDGQATVPVFGDCGFALAGGTAYPEPGYGLIEKYLVKTDRLGATDCDDRRVEPEVRTPPMICDHYEPQWEAFDNVLNWEVGFQRRGALDEALCYRSFCEPCPADLDEDGDADADDFFLYLDLFAAGDPEADLDGDGDTDADDFFAYLDLFAAGC